MTEGGNGRRTTERLSVVVVRSVGVGESDADSGKHAERRFALHTVQLFDDGQAHREVRRPAVCRTVANAGRKIDDVATRVMLAFIPDYHEESNLATSTVGTDAGVLARDRCRALSPLDSDQRLTICL